MKNRYKEPLVLKALEFFVRNSYGEVYLREFGRSLGISPNSAQRFLDVFLKEGFVNEIRRGNLRYFKANMDSVVFRQMKIVFSLNKIEKSGLINVLKEEGIGHVVLFGSVARGEDDLNSDIDLVVVGGNKSKIRGAVNGVEGKLGREVNLHVFSWSEWKKSAGSNRAFYQDVIMQGLCLIGEKPVVE